MKRHVVAGLCLVFLLSLTAAGAPPPEIDYQGKILVNDIPLTGPGYFKYAISDAAGTGNYWAHDGTATGEPATFLTNECYNGVFSVLLGSDPMQDIDPDIFAVEGTDLVLRVWFSEDGITFNEMLPAQELVSAPYAINSDQVDGYDADELIAAATNAFTETDPVFGASDAAGITASDISNWDAAYGWGDHSGVGYLTSETDPIFGASAAAGITAGNIVNWNAAFGWGDHALAGYLTGETDPVWTSASNLYYQKPAADLRFVNVTGDTMTGALTINAPLGLRIDSASNEVAIGNAATAADNGTALGVSASGGGFGTALGAGASGTNHGAAVGHNASAGSYGVAVGADATGVATGTAVGASARGDNGGAAVGSQAKAFLSGAALGFEANGNTNGAAVGYSADGKNLGAAVGFDAMGADGGAALGYDASGDTQGAAVGQSSRGYNGAALGYTANGSYLGAAVGYEARASWLGAALGGRANGGNTNVAIGYYSSSGGGSERIAIGHNVTNSVNESARLRGTFWMDGGTGLVARPVFGTGLWKTLVPLPPLDNVIYVATNGTPAGPGNIDRPFDTPQNGYNFASARFAGDVASLVIAGGKYPGLIMNRGNVHVFGVSRPQLASLSIMSGSSNMLGKQRVENIIADGITTVAADGGSDVKFHNCRFQRGLQIYGPRVEVQDCYATGSDGPATTVGSGASPISEIAIYNSSMFNKDSANPALLVNPNVYFFEVIGCEIVNYDPLPGVSAWAAIEDQETTLHPVQPPHLYSHNVIRGAEHGTSPIPAVFDSGAVTTPTITFVHNTVWGDVGVNSNAQFYANNVVYGDIWNKGGLIGWAQAGLGTGLDTSGNTEHQGIYPQWGAIPPGRGFPGAWQD